MKKTKEASQNCRLWQRLMLITPALVVLSFGRGLILYGRDIDGLKTAFLVIFFFWWCMCFPMAGISGRGMRYSSRAMQAKSDFQEYISKYVLPPIIMAAFLWMTFTTWKCPDWEYRSEDVIRGQTNNQNPAR